MASQGKLRHFVTQGFDWKGNEKVRVQTLSGLVHVDYKKPGLYSYAEMEKLSMEYIMRMNDKDLVGRLRKIMLDQLPNGGADQERVADALHMSARTLHRKLRQKGTSYRLTAIPDTNVPLQINPDTNQWEYESCPSEVGCWVSPC